METATPSTSSTRRIAILLVAVAFVAGALIGFAGGRVYSIFHLLRGSRSGSAEAVRERILHHLDSELKLTPQQHAQIAQIMDRHHKRMQEITDTVRPQMRQEIDAANREIDAVLTPDQRTKYDAMQMRLQRLGRRRR